jgi:glycosyltransferase involved in cell wall biosynthesis
MDQKRIGIIYNFDENWIGGAYYIQNLIRSLNYLPKKEQIQLYILTKDKCTFQEFQKATGYSNLKFIEYPYQYSIPERLINKVGNIILKRKIIVNEIKLDWVFPLYNLPDNLKNIKKIIFWIPDLQEKFLPEFFSEDEIIQRHNCYQKMVELNHSIVFSSYSALNDFNTFYPDSKNDKKMMQFAVVTPNLKSKDINEIKTKYGIVGDYFFSPNQFWQHKNQIAIIEATKIIKNLGKNIKIIFTGKEFDYRNPEYTSNLKKKIIEYELENEILFLGFIDRSDQLLLMKNAQAVIQPSFFEGWSTVVEDAKAMNQTLIVSNIEVHKEQLGDKGYFFSPNDYNELANKIIWIIEKPDDKLKYDLDYSENIIRFAKNLKKLINNNLD